MANMNGRILELIERKRYSGTTAFLTNPDMNAVLGAGDRVILHAIIDDANSSNGTGTVKLTVTAQDGSDGDNFADFAGNDLIDMVSISAAENIRAVVDFPHGRFLRFRVALSATSGIPDATMTIRASIKSA